MYGFPQVGDMAVAVDPGSPSRVSSDKEATCCRLYSVLLNLLTGWVVIALV